MLGAEAFIHVAFCFFPRKDNNFPAFVGKSLEHYASFVMLTPRDVVDKTREIAYRVVLISLGVARIECQARARLTSFCCPHTLRAGYSPLFSSSSMGFLLQP